MKPITVGDLLREMFRPARRTKAPRGRLASCLKDWKIAPCRRASAEGGAVSVPLLATGASLVFGASGLPSGLGIDPASGLISGTLDYSDAETGGGV